MKMPSPWFKDYNLPLGDLSLTASLTPWVFLSYLIQIHFPLYALHTKGPNTWLTHLCVYVSICTCGSMCMYVCNIPFCLWLYPDWLCSSCTQIVTFLRNHYSWFLIAKIRHSTTCAYKINFLLSLLNVLTFWLLGQQGKGFQNHVHSTV